MGVSLKYKWLMAVAGALLAGFVVWYFHTIIFYILAALVLSLVGHPIINLIEKVSIKGWKPPRWLSAMLALIILLALLLGAAYMLIPLIVEKLQVLSSFDPHELNNIMREPAMKLEKWVNTNFPMANFSVKDTIIEKVMPMFNSGIVRDIFAGITGFMIDSFVALFSISFIAFFFLKDEKLFNEGVVTLFPKRYEQNIIRAISSSFQLLIRYFVGIFIESLIKFIVVGFSLYFLGMELSTALLIGLIIGVLNVIPYIGPLFGGVIGFVIAIMSPGVEGATMMELLIEISIVLLVFQFIDNIILQPYIYSSSVKAHPLEIFIVILMAGYIAGVLGMLLAIPAYTVIRVFAKEFFANLRVVQKLTENL